MFPQSIHSHRTPKSRRTRLWHFIVGEYYTRRWNIWLIGTVDIVLAVGTAIAVATNIITVESATKLWLIWTIIPLLFGVITAIPIYLRQHVYPQLHPRNFFRIAKWCLIASLAMTAIGISFPEWSFLLVISPFPNYAIGLLLLAEA